MRWFDTLRLTTRSLLLRNHVENELEAELRFHIDRQTDENIRAGMSAEAARLSALRTTGSVMRIKEQCRETFGVRLLDQLRQDVRYALRSFRRTPGFTVVAAVTLALGIGATTAIFSAVNAALMKPLPFTSPEQLVNIRETDRRGRGSVSVFSGNFVEWRNRASSFQEAAAWRLEYFNVTGNDEPEQVQGLRVSERARRGPPSGRFPRGGLSLGARATNTFEEKPTWNHFSARFNSFPTPSRPGGGRSAMGGASLFRRTRRCLR